MDTDVIKAPLGSYGLMVSISDLGRVFELHAFHRSMTIDVNDDATATSHLKIVRVDGNSVKDLAVGIVKLAQLSGVDLLTGRQMGRQVHETVSETMEEVAPPPPVEPRSTLSV